MHYFFILQNKSENSLRMCLNQIAQQKAQGETVLAGGSMTDISGRHLPELVGTVTVLPGDNDRTGVLSAAVARSTCDAIIRITTDDCYDEAFWSEALANILRVPAPVGLCAVGCAPLAASVQDIRGQQSIGSSLVFFDYGFLYPVTLFSRQQIENQVISYAHDAGEAQDYEFLLNASLKLPLSSQQYMVCGTSCPVQTAERLNDFQSIRKRSFLMAGFQLNERDLFILEAFSTDNSIRLVKQERREVERLADFLIGENRRLGFRPPQAWDAVVNYFRKRISYV